MSLHRKASNDAAPAERFADYFVVCGLDEVEGLEPHHSGESDLSALTPLQLSYKPNVLWHYPENDPTNVFEPDGIKILCMPRGCYFRKTVAKKKERFHSFLQTREDGTKIYGFVLTFYERIKNDKMVLAMDTLFRMFDNESLLKSPGRSSKQESKESRLKRTRSYYSYSKEREELYVTKCICLVMKKPYVTIARRCLENILYTALNETESTFPIESYIYNVLYEIPSPPPGRAMRYISLEGDPVIVLNPNLNELPFFDYSMIEVLMTLGFDNLVDLFTCMLLEHQILFLSNDIHKLMLIAESLTALFFPLLWQHVYVPVLPPSLLHFLDAPVPFIMGLYYETEEEKNRLEIPCEGGLCLLDIDNNEIQLPQEIPELPGRTDLINELKTMATKYGIHPPEGSISFKNELSGSAQSGLDSTLDQTHSDSEQSSSLDTSLTDHSLTGTWPRKKNRSSQENGKGMIGSPAINRRMASANSPLTARKKFPASNWAGEMTPQVHRDATDNYAPNNGLVDDNSSPNSSPRPVNPRLAAMMALAEKAGLNTTEILKNQKIQENSVSENLSKKDDLFVLNNRALTVSRKQQHENEFNIVVRELFVNCFTQMLVDYEHFVILPRQTKEDWLNNREHMQNFDKASFLSDQSFLNLPFMTLFVESQGFASLIDMKIMALWEECDPRLTYFDKRIDKLKVKLGIIRSHVYEKCTSINSAVDTYVKRCSHIDHNAAQPHALKVEVTRERANGYFPIPEKAGMVETKRKKAGRINWRKRDKLQQQSEHILLNEAIKVSHAEGQKIKEKLAERVKKYMQESKMISKDTSAVAGGAHKTLSAFADKLLKECKIKTKRLVVLKLGQEAVELGHAGSNTLGIEENTLIASLCDLLERVWSHGVQLRKLEFGGKESSRSKFVQRMRQSKSALWSHLIAFYQKESERLAAVYGLSNVENVAEEIKKLIVEANKQPAKKQSTVDALTENLTRAIRSKSPDFDNEASQNKELERLMEEHAPTSLPNTPTMPSAESRRQQELLARVGFLNNLKTVIDMKEIKTDTGYARAWTRLALEKKVLAKELKILLSQKKLLNSRYKEYAFIRTDDEMEQFLYHLLSLNAVDFYCFTNGFSSTMTTYKVHILLGKNMGSASTANCWINLSGSLANTGTIAIPRGDLEFRFMHKNLGILTALRIGHDNTGLSPGWFIDFVAITNEVTGQLYRFQCGRWLAKSQDDGSTERLLIAEMVNLKRMNEKRTNSTLCLGISDKPPVPATLPTVRRMTLFSKKLTSGDVQEKVADAVNNIVKFFYKDSDDNMTYLLCGEGGFCDALQLVFQYGFKASRLFGKKLFVWDYIERVHEDFVGVATRLVSAEELNLRTSFCTVVQTINTADLSIGKNQKFQVFICFGLRGHHLKTWFKLLHESTVTSQMYESSSFFRDVNFLNFLIDVLEALAEFDVVLDKSITRGIKMK